MPLLFVAPETVRNEELPAMSRLSVDDFVDEAAELRRLGVPAVLLFGVPPAEDKDEQATAAWDDDGIVQFLALRVLAAEQPDLVLARRLPLRVHEPRPLRRATRRRGAERRDAELLARTAASHVEAGADAVAPSDMMDGRVGAIREVLPTHPSSATPPKAASAFYGPFREPPAARRAKETGAAISSIPPTPARRPRMSSTSPRVRTC